MTGYKVKYAERDTIVKQHNKKCALSSLSQADTVVINTTEPFLKKTLNQNNAFHSL